MSDRVLSADVEANWPHFHLKTKVLRTHEETFVHPWFKWIKRKVTVIDQLQFIGVVVTQQGRSYEIPLQGSVNEAEPSS